VLSNAKEKGSKDNSNDNLTLKVVASSDKVDVAEHVTQAVEVTGTVDASAAKSDVTTLTATKIKWRADYCG
jgi:hypothetical protein